jgi:hypothetical protein
VVPRGHGWTGSKEYNAQPKGERYFATRRIIVFRHNYNILHPPPQLTRFEAAYARYSTFNHEHNFPLEIKLELSSKLYFLFPYAAPGACSISTPENRSNRVCWWRWIVIFHSHQSYAAARNLLRDF